MAIAAPLEDNFGLLNRSVGVTFIVSGISCISNNKTELHKLSSKVWNCGDIPEKSQMGRETWACLKELICQPSKRK